MSQEHNAIGHILKAVKAVKAEVGPLSTACKSNKVASEPLGLLLLGAESQRLKNYISIIALMMTKISPFQSSDVLVHHWT